MSLLKELICIHVSVNSNSNNITVKAVTCPFRKTNKKEMLSLKNKIIIELRLA